MFLRDRKISISLSSSTAFVHRIDNDAMSRSAVPWNTDQCVRITVGHPTIFENNKWIRKISREDLRKSVSVGAGHLLVGESHVDTDGIRPKLQANVCSRRCVPTRRQDRRN